jgi:Pyruvate/2-oxoacid:ferredoxin oxidoreductase delta subunit
MRRILFCQCSYARVLPLDVKAAVLRALRAAGAGFDEVADLCELSARQDPALKRLAGGGAIQIAACYPRAVKWLFAAARAPLPADRTQVLNLRTQSAQEIIASLLGREVRPNLPGGQGGGKSPAAAMAASLASPPPVGGAPADVARAPAHARGRSALGPALAAGARAAVGGGVVDGARGGRWEAWFPVIDFDRCTNCLQCLSFCLFGVYGVDGQRRIQVRQPDHCKSNCPACSRVCPEAAIMFPKYKSGPINGEAVSEAGLQREKMRIDVSALLGGDVYARLRERSQRARSRFSRARDPETALRERQKCLARLVEAGVIPPEVLPAGDLKVKGR